MDTSSSDAASASQQELFTRTTPAIPKRIILEYVNGDWAGMFQIIGLIADAPPSHITGPFQVGDGPIIEFASLIRVGYKFVHYREVVDRSKFAGRLGDYMPGNRTGDFDPNQV